jgi:hypothetical protein
MSLHIGEDGVAAGSLDDAARRVAAALLAGEGISPERARELLAAGVIAYAARRQDGDAGRPFPPGHGVTATDAAVTTTAILEDLNIAIFELGLWQSMAPKK